MNADRQSFLNKRWNADNVERRKELTLASTKKAYAAGVAARAAACAGGCQMCGTAYPPCVMEFHHIGKKSFPLTVRQFADKDAGAVADEAAKCVLLCANCHRMVHHSGRPFLVTGERGSYGIEWLDG